jgi:hypothetical protein
MGGFGSGRRSSGAPMRGRGACIVGCAELALSFGTPPRARVYFAEKSCRSLIFLTHVPVRESQVKISVNESLRRASWTKKYCAGT